MEEKNKKNISKKKSTNKTTIKKDKNLSTTLKTEEYTFDNVVLTNEEIRKELEKEKIIKKPVKRKRRLKNWVYIALIIIFTLLLGFSLFKIFVNKPLNNKLNKKYIHSIDGGYREYDIDFKGLKELNKNTVGYVKLNATKINHVVIKGKDNNFYKDHNYLNKKSKNGWIFMDSRNKLDGTDKNIVIYGNDDNSMFGSLSKVLTNKWHKNKFYHYVTYVSENNENRYQVFSTYETNKENIKVDFKKQIDYHNYIKSIKSKSNYDYNVDVNSYDQILTLVSYNKNKLIVLHAKMIKN